MKTNMKTLNYSLNGAVCAGALLLASGVSAQNLFTSDYNTGNVYSYTPGGTPSTFATGFDHPFSVAFNANGDLFVANTALNANQPEIGSITEITRGGTRSTFYSGIDPIALTFYAGNLFEADYKSGNIYEYTPGGVQSLFASGFTTPLSLAFDSTGDLYVGSGFGNGNGIITKVSPNGTTQTPFASGLSFVGGLTFDGANLLVSQQTTGTILQYTPGGVQSTFATVNAAGLGAMAYDNSDNLFVVTGPSIVEIASGGTQSTFASGLSDGAGLAFQPVPEPSTFALLGVGAAAFYARRRR
jgi:PEP-CTERM motif